MKTSRNILLLLLLAVISFSCKKQIETTIIPRHDNIQTSVAKLTGEVAAVLSEVYTDRQSLMEVNAAIYSGFYEDERVLLKDLLFPSQSMLYRSKEFQKFKIDTGAFRRRFFEVVLSGTYPLLSAELKVTNRSLKGLASAVQIVNDNQPSILSAKSPVSIYFPYSENFGNAQVYDILPPTSKLAMVLKPTIVYTDRESDNAPGKRPYVCATSPDKVCYTDVTVSDSYAETNATHIVTIGATPATPATPGVLPSEQVTRVYHGYSRLTRQMDKLVSMTGNGGGSEIKVCRINGYLRKSNEQITDFSGDVVTVQYTRADIRKKRWKRVYSIWDSNWNYQDAEQVYAVYEDDTRGTKTISGTLSTSVTLPAKLGKAEGQVNFKLEVFTQDDIITQKKIDRKSYLRDGLNNQGAGFMSDVSDFLPAGRNWPIIDGGAIWSYTLPYRIY